MEGISKAREYRMKAKYNITPEQFMEMYDRQGGMCPICGKKLNLNITKAHRLRVVIDHNHESGKVRGLLHSVCNAYISIMEKYSGNVAAYFRNNDIVLYAEMVSAFNGSNIEEILENV